MGGMRVRIAVVDDERPARSELKYLLEQCEPEAEIAEGRRKRRISCNAGE